MMVLGIAASPRKGGNTDILVTEALNAAKNEGAQTDIIFLREKQIADCDGCRSCLRTGKCHVQDDMQEINERLIGADGLILGSPCYFTSVSGLCQCFMDRTWCLFINPKTEVDKPKLSRLNGKVGGVVAVGMRRGVSRTLFTLFGFFHQHGMLIVPPGVMGIVKDYERGGVRRQDEIAMATAKQLGTQVVALLRKLGME